LAVEDTIRVGIEVADALGAAHRVRLLHGAIQPDCILGDADGGVLYECVVGQPPPTEAGPPDLLTTRPGLPSAMARMISKRPVPRRGIDGGGHRPTRG
jgi:hypothetical protein